MGAVGRYERRWLSDEALIQGSLFLLFRKSTIDARFAPRGRG
jgi:hypothetical protein